MNTDKSKRRGPGTRGKALTYKYNSAYLPQGTPEEYAYMRRLLQSTNRNQIEEPARLIWLNSWLNWGTLSQRVVVSKIPSNCPFTKTNMSIGLRNAMPFLFEKSEITALIPRTYELRIDGDMKNFQKHFRITACTCILKKFVTTPLSSITTEGTVPLECVDFAVKRIVELLQLVQHDDLDEWNFSIVKDSEWENFLLRFYDIAHYDAKFQINSAFDLVKMNTTCKKLLDFIYKAFPDMKYEGTRNLWIVKPAAGSCGRGVKVFRKLRDIEQNCKAECSYVIQKYIEMPLLIYNTKFDIRQWFVITSVSPMILWMYDECYLRFCSQEFCLSNLHESVHLCNNTVQWKYKNGVRSSKLPHDNMWDNYVFADYLKKELKQDQWSSIQDQMRQALIAVCVAAQDRMYHRPNSFQLYGADFMLTPDFKVWLIEVNGQPAMKYSTSVTARMCKAVLEDTVKLGLLRRNNPTIKVGKFKEIYHQATEHPKTQLPAAGIVHAKKSTFLPNNSIVTNNVEPENNSRTKSKLSYENLVTYKSHPKVQIKPKVKSDKPLYPGDATQSILEENVILSGTLESKKILDKPNDGYKKGENKTNSTEKDGERQFTQNKILPEKKRAPLHMNPKKYITKTSQVEPDNDIIELLTETAALYAQENKINIIESDFLDNSDMITDHCKSRLPKSILETTKRALSTIKMFSNFIKKEHRAEPFEEPAMDTIKLTDGFSYTNLSSIEKDTDCKRTLSIKKWKLDNQEFIDRSEIINLISDNSIEEDNRLYSGEIREPIVNEMTAKEPAEDSMTQCSSFDDIFTHDIITGKELLPELSGYAFIGESCDDRRLECILNSSEFLSCIGKSDEKIKPIFKAFVDDFEVSE